MNERLVTPQGYGLAVTENLIPGARVTGIIVHGFQSSRKSPAAIAALEALLESGVNGVIFDLYAHGDSDGDFKDMSVAKAIDNVEAVIKHVHDRDPTQKIILIGSSFGGLVSQYVAVKFAPLITALILRAAVSNWWELWKERITEDEIKNWKKTGYHTGEVRDGIQTTFGLEFLGDIQRQDIYTDVAPQIKVPTLIIHGDADEVVPLSQSRELKKHIPLSDLVVLPEADHRFTDTGDMAAYQHHIENFLRKSRII
ncbi:MAG TPA: alpha/beta fold hydrolase [Alphaproteobacteria bacterium]